MKKARYVLFIIGVLLCACAERAELRSTALSPSGSDPSQKELQEGEVGSVDEKTIEEVEPVADESERTPGGGGDDGGDDDGDDKVSAKKYVTLEALRINPIRRAALLSLKQFEQPQMPKQEKVGISSKELREKLKPGFGMMFLVVVSCDAPDKGSCLKTKARVIHGAARVPHLMGRTKSARVKAGNLELLLSINK